MAGFPLEIPPGCSGSYLLRASEKWEFWVNVTQSVWKCGHFSTNDILFKELMMVTSWILSKKENEMLKENVSHRMKRKVVCWCSKKHKKRTVFMGSLGKWVLFVSVTSEHDNKNKFLQTKHWRQLFRHWWVTYFLVSHQDTFVTRDYKCFSLYYSNCLKPTGDDRNTVKATEMITHACELGHHLTKEKVANTIKEKSVNK